MVIKNYTVQSSQKELIHADLRYDLGAQKVPTVLILHGFKGFKDWGFFPDLCQRFTESGYATICFNFSRNGIGEDPNSFTEFDKFATNTYSQEISDVRSVLKAIDDRTIGKHIIDPERLAILGHSRGGAVAILSALENPDRFQAVITWSSISHLDRYSDGIKKEWKKRGYTEVKNARTGQIFKIDASFLSDLEKNKKRYNLEERMAELEADSLFIHGTDDTSVPPVESEELYEWCGAYHKKLELIEGADHTYNIKHPFSMPVKNYELAYTLSENWLDNVFLI